tara:strand:- start:229 stop:1512 length:1284 start_codon:yes stop_codon:yes gene_type:complete
MLKKHLLYLIPYIFSLIVFIGLNIYNSGGVDFSKDFLLKISSPLIFTFSIFLLFSITKKYNFLKNFLSYGLFFLISIFSLMGLASNINGSHAESTNIFIYGLSFYSALLAFKIHQNNLKLSDIFVAGNPLLLISGPISVFFNKIGLSLKKRISYYFPFILIGFFFFKVISAPMTYYLKMVSFTEPLTILLFAALFRIFLYFNFAGISLMIYGIFGIFGRRIPLNFTQPFSSRNVIEFWRSWHASLSMVLKQLFYSPARKKFNNPYLAVFTVYIASAMWHGMTLNFIFWGTFHSVIFILTSHLLKMGYVRLPITIFLIAIPFGDIMFTDTDLPRLLTKLSNFLNPTLYFEVSMISFFNSIMQTPKYVLASTLVAFFIISIEFFYLKNRLVAKKNYRFLRTNFALSIILILMVLLISGQGWEYAAYGQR